jgi:hypothetical protein
MPSLDISHPVRSCASADANTTDSDLRRLLLWCTGNDSMPAPLPRPFIEIKRTADPSRCVFGHADRRNVSLLHSTRVCRLPAAHVCFHSIDMPEYASLAVLRAKLLLALDNSDGAFSKSGARARSGVLIHVVECSTCLRRG